MGTDEIHRKILMYLSNESFNNAVCKLFEKCIGYEMISYIWKTAIVKPLHKGLTHLKSSSWPVF